MKPWPRKSALLVIAALLGTACAWGFLWYTSLSGPIQDTSARVGGPRIPMAILGDSDSHSYQDSLSFPLEEGQRGGVHRPVTWQWTDIVAHLRGQELDLGEWGIWGQHKVIARAQDALGLGGRAPRKQDFQFNFAYSGLQCEALVRFRTAQRLIKLMDRAPDQWARGVVVIRIGINDLGVKQALQALSVNPQDPQMRARIDTCVDQYTQAVRLIHARHPQTRIVLVGLFNNAHWATHESRWQTAREVQNIQQGVDAFNSAVQSLASQDPRLAYFDDDAWSVARWGSRDPSGQPAYRVVNPDGRHPTTHSRGDGLQHAFLADGHNGTVWNLLWAQSLIDLLNQRFAMGIRPLSQPDLARFLQELDAKRP